MCNWGLSEKITLLGLCDLSSVESNIVAYRYKLTVS